MHLRLNGSSRRALKLGLPTAGLLLSLVAFSGVAGAAPMQHAWADSHNSSYQSSQQRQNTLTLAVPITALSGNAVALGSSGDTSAYNASGVAVIPTQTSAQSNDQHSAASAHNTSSNGGEDCGCGGDARQRAGASSHNDSSQSSNQRQNTVTVAVPVTALSGNAVSLGSSGDTSAGNASGVAVLPTQSSTQSSSQHSSASASNSSRGGDCGCADGTGQRAYASSGNSSRQSSRQRQNTVTVAVPITVLSGNAVSAGSSGDTSANNASGVLVAPTQTNRQSSDQHSSATASNAAHTSGCGCAAGARQKAAAHSHNHSSQSSNQRQNTVTVAVPVTALSGNAVSLGSSGDTSAHNASGVLVTPTQSSTQSSSQHSSASAANSAASVPCCD